MELETKNLMLRTVTKEDVSEVARMYEYPNVITLENTEKAICKMIENHKQNRIEYIKHLCLAVCLKEKQTVIIGWCSLDGEIEKDKVVLFYIIDKQYRQKCCATQCAKALLKYAFETAKLNCVHGGCNKNNEPSYKIRAKLV